MADESGSTSQTQTAQAGDEKKSGNVTLAQMTGLLLKRGEDAMKKATAANVTIAAAAAGETAAPAAPAEVTTSSGTTEAPDGAEGDDLSQSTELDPKLQAKIDKRIGKEVAKRKAVEAQLETAKAEMAKAMANQQPVIQSSPDNPLAHVQDTNALDKEKSAALNAKLWAQEQLDRDDIDQGVKVGEKTYSKAELKSIVRNTDKVLTTQIPEREKFLAKRADSEARSKQMFPWMKEPDSDEFKGYQHLMRTAPEIINSPNGPWVANVLIKGMKELNAEIAAQQNGTKPAKKPQAPASQVASGAAPGAIREASGTQAVKRLAAEVERLKGKGNVSVRDVAKYLLAKETSK